MADSTHRHEETIGRYEILRPLAAGGMAHLHLARFRSIEGFEKLAVIKRLRPEHAESSEMVGMFLSEARLLANMQHPNIVHVYDVGESGGFYFAMEYLEGQDLRRVLRKLQGQLPLEQTLFIVASALAGLHYMHERRGADGELLGIVHRDVSPANIFITYDGTLKILDLGVAKIESTYRTRAGVLKGKVRYMAPEQVGGKKIDRRTDVFAAGIVLWELTVGRRLFDGTDVEVILQIASQPTPPPSVFCPDYPPELERIVMKALDRDPSTRYQTAREMQQDLEAFAREAKMTLSAAGLEAFMARTFADEMQAQGGRPRALISSRLPPPLRDSPSQSGIIAGSRDPQVTAPLAHRPWFDKRYLLAAGAGMALLALGLGAARLVLAARASTRATEARSRPAAVETSPTVPDTASAAAPDPVSTPPAASAIPFGSPALSSAPALPSAPAPSARVEPSADPLGGADEHPRPIFTLPRAGARPRIGPMAPPRLAPSDAEGKAPASAGPAHSGVNCNPPYTVDTNGIEHFKPGCL
jgi:serine/threonine protein kinase